MCCYVGTHSSRIFVAEKLQDFLLFVHRRYLEFIRLKVWLGRYKFPSGLGDYYLHIVYQKKFPREYLVGKVHYVAERFLRGSLELSKYYPSLLHLQKFLTIQSSCS